ncbi:MAG TPA: hypothetical protein VMV05_04540 [bacterium]|nr:hypothetical protein [bacterium]
MSLESNNPPPGQPNLQFEKAEFDSSRPSSPACQACKKEIRGSYFEINGKVFCEPCKMNLEKFLAGGSPTKRFLRAFFAGSGAALAGAGLYYGIEKWTGYEFGLIAIVVGFMVGVAVRWGSHRRGGWGYQLLAVFLTYNAIVMTYIPYIVEGYKDKTKQSPSQNPAGTPLPTPAASTPSASSIATPMTATVHDTVPAPAAPQTVAAVETPAPPKKEINPGKALIGIGALFLLAYLLPFMMGVKNIVGILIIAFGLYQAWKINARPKLVIKGPFQTGPPRP